MENKITNQTKISLVIPCFNEEQSLPLLFGELKKVESMSQQTFEYLFINDGSTDATLQVLRDFQEENPDTVHYLSFSRNFGKEAALYAGLKAVTGDYVALMDADLQDPPALLLEMIEKIQEPDVDCLAARRMNRKGEPFLRSVSSRLFYWLMGKMSSVPVLSGVRDYRLMSRQMVNSVLELSEYNRFTKGLLTWVGYNTEYIAYENQERVAGKTSWRFWDLVKYSMDGMINFSEIPLNIAMYSGLTAVFLSVVAIFFLIFRQLLFHNSVSGWTSMSVIIIFCSGFILLMLGIIGKYISKIFMETKKRPIYIVKEEK